MLSDRAWARPSAAATFLTKSARSPSRQIRSGSLVRPAFWDQSSHNGTSGHAPGPGPASRVGPFRVAEGRPGRPVLRLLTRLLGYVVHDGGVIDVAADKGGRQP